MKRVLPEVEPEARNDRCLYWTEEQNRWIDVISAWVLQNPRLSHDSFRHAFALIIKGDLCMPLATRSVFVMNITAWSGVRVEVKLPASLMDEFSRGWRLFTQEVIDMVLVRCAMTRDKGDAANRALPDEHRVNQHDQLEVVCYTNTFK